MKITNTDMAILKQGLLRKQPSAEILGKYKDLLAEIKKADEIEDRNRKESLLKHYAKKEPTQFYQFDSYCNYLPPDQGDELDMCKTWELMNGSSVRVLIRTGISEKEAIRLLLKIIEWITSVGFEDLEREKEDVPMNLVFNDWAPEIETDVPM